MNGDTYEYGKKAVLLGKEHREYETIEIEKEGIV